MTNPPSAEISKKLTAANFSKESPLKDPLLRPDSIPKDEPHRIFTLGRLTDIQLIALSLGFLIPSFLVVCYFDKYGLSHFFFKKAGYSNPSLEPILLEPYATSFGNLAGYQIKSPSQRLLFLQMLVKEFHPHLGLTTMERMANSTPKAHVLLSELHARADAYQLAHSVPANPPAQSTLSYGSAIGAGVLAGCLVGSAFFVGMAVYCFWPAIHG